MISNFNFFNNLTEGRLLLFWILVGYIVMIVIYFIPSDISEFLYNKSIYLDWIPIIRSTENPSVFNGLVARLHASALLVISPLIVFSFFFIGRGRFISKATGGQRLTLLVIFPILSIFLMLTSIDGGSVGKFFVSSPFLFPFISTLSFSILGFGVRCIYAIVVEY